MGVLDVSRLFSDGSRKRCQSSVEHIQVIVTSKSPYERIDKTHGTGKML